MMGGSYINAYWWFLDGVYKRWGSVYTITFNLPAGVNSKTYAVKLKVRDDEYQYGYRTVNITVNRPVHYYFYVKDHLGSTRAVVNENGDVVETNDYYPFGLKSRSNIHSVDAAKESYTGKEQDVESNLYYFGARFYDPAAVRWLSVDPLAGKYPSRSPYHYVNNDPINLIDPNGKEEDGNANAMYQVRSDLSDEGKKAFDVAFSKTGAVGLDVVAAALTSGGALVPATAMSLVGAVNNVANNSDNIDKGISALTIVGGALEKSIPGKTIFAVIQLFIDLLSNPQYEFQAQNDFNGADNTKVVLTELDESDNNESKDEEKKNESNDEKKKTNYGYDDTAIEK